MFFISWGSKVVRLMFGAPETRHCEICHEDKTFHKVVIYRVHHIWWIFRWVSQKSYGLVCDICHNGQPIDARTAEAAAGKSPIPFWDRMGWTAGLGLVAFGVGSVAVAGAVNSSRTAAALERPAVGDIYEVNLARMDKAPEAANMYSSLLVTSVTADAVEAHLPKSYFTRLSGIEDAVADGRARDPGFYSDETVRFTHGGLKRAHDVGGIISVERQTAP